MKKDRIYLTKERLLQGLAGMLLSVSALVLPVTGYAENVKPQQEPVSAGTADTRGAEPAQGNRGPVVPTYVMPQEQVYLDPSQGTGISGSQPGGSSKEAAGSGRLLQCKSPKRCAGK